MTEPIDTAYVEIRAESSKFGSDVAAAVDREMNKAGRKIQDSVTKPVENAGRSIGSVFSGLGNSVANGLRPGLTQVQNFRAGFDNAQASASSFTGRMGTLGGAVRTALNPGITAAQNFHAGLVSSDAAASAFTGKIGTLGGAIGSTFRTGVTVVQDFGTVGEQVASRVSTGFSTAATNLKSKLGGALSLLKSQALLLGGVLGAGGLGALVSAGFNRISDIEQTTKSLEVMTGSASRAKDVMTELLTFARTTPFAFPDISQIGRNLISFGIDTNKVIPIMKALGDAASASGQGTEGLKSLGIIIGQIASKGKLQGDELLQLAENGIPALRILANVAGKSTQDMQKAISAGTVDSNFAIDALVKGIENGTNGIAGSTAKMGGIMASQKDTIVGTLDSFKSSVSSTMATLIEPYIPAFRASVNAIGNGFKLLPGFVAQAKQLLTSSGFFDAVRSIFTGIRTIIAAVWPVIQTFVKSFAAAFGGGLLIGLRLLGGAFQWLGGMIKTLQPVLQPIATVLGVVWGATMLLRGALLAGGAAMLVWKGIMVAFGPIMKIFTALQWALNVALDANPISLIVIAIAALVAAFVILWNKSAGFRQFWIGLWQAISSFFVGVWNTMKTVFTTVIDALKTAWNATWKFISDVISAVWNGFLKPIFDAIVTVVHAVGDAASWLWNNILHPVFTFIGNAALIMGKIVLGLVLIPMVAFWRFVLAPVLQFLGDVFSAVWNGIKDVVTTVWNAVWGFLTAAWNAFTQYVQLIWNGFVTVVTTVWNAILAAIQFVWNAIWNFISPAITAFSNWFRGAWNAISTFFSDLWIGLKAIVMNTWNTISGWFTGAFNTFVGWFKSAWNGVSSFFSDLWNGMIKIVKEVWSQVSDIAMKPIRFVVNTVLDDGLIAGWNKVVDFLKLSFLHIPEIPRLATGGIIPGYTPGRDTHIIGVGGGEAVMRPEWTRAAGANYVNAANAAARTGGVSGAGEFIARNGLPGFASGGIIDNIINNFIGGVLGSVGLNPNPTSGGQRFDFSNPVASMQDMLGTILNAMNFGGVGDVGRIIELAAQAPKSMITGMVGKFKEWWDSQAATPLSSGASPGVSGDRATNRAIVHSIFSSLFGWSNPVELAATDDLVMGESGYNNTIKNPTSTAYGIFQFLDSTWAGTGIAKTSDPTQQAIAGGRYIRGRYGDPIAANIFKHAHNWYRRGGIIPAFDNGGGLAPGLNLSWNGTGRTENVRSPAAEDKTNALLEQLVELLAGRVAQPARVAVSVMLDGKVMQQWFQETEIMGGL